MSTEPFREVSAFPEGEVRPTAGDDAVLQVRHGFYMEAMRLFANAESREQRFELLHASFAFEQTALVREALQAVGIAPGDEAGVDLFVMGVSRPHHHNRHYERWLSVCRQLSPEAAQVLLDASFSFLTAWTHRYGGIEGDLTTDGRLVDPGRAPGR